MDAFGIVVAIVVATVVFFMIRDILCWYWKIDTIIEKLDTILGELTDLDEISRKLTNLDDISENRDGK